MAAAADYMHQADFDTDVSLHQHYCIRPVQCASLAIIAIHPSVQLPSREMTGRDERWAQLPCCYWQKRGLPGRIRKRSRSPENVPLASWRGGGGPKRKIFMIDLDHGVAFAIWQPCPGMLRLVFADNGCEARSDTVLYGTPWA
jgi:hypothetical protein